MDLPRPRVANKVNLSNVGWIFVKKVGYALLFNNKTIFGQYYDGI